MANMAFREWTPNDSVNEPICPAELLPKDDLVFFLLDLGSNLDLSPFHAHYEGETRGLRHFIRR